QVVGRSFFLAEHRPDTTVDDLIALTLAEADTVFFDAGFAAAGNDGAQFAARQVGGRLQPGYGRFERQRAYPPIGLAAVDVVGVGLQEFDMAAREQRRQDG